MADLKFVGFALMPGPVKKERQFGLPDDFCKIDVTILSRMSHPESSFPVVFRELKQRFGILFLIMSTKTEKQYLYSV